jgi:RNA polymerase sigma factor (sigma-70 family)
MSRESDNELLEAWAGGDPRAAEELIRGQMDRVYGLCLSLVRDPQVASELSQEAVLRLYKSLPRFRGDCAWSTWSYRIARNLCLNWLEKRREDTGDDGTQMSDPRGGPHQEAIGAQRDALVRGAIEASLDAEEREAVLLHYEAGLSVAEVTEVMALENASGARGLLQRARRKLRREVVQSMEEDSIVQRAMTPKQRERIERTLQQLSAEVSTEPTVRPMRKRGNLLD